MQQRAEFDFKLREQAEAHARKEKSLVEQKQRAEMNVTSVYMASRSSHVSAKRAIDEVADVQQQVRLASGAVERVAKVARMAMAAAPPERRAKLEGDLSVSRMALSASQVTMSQSAKRAGTVMARAVKHTRESQIGVYKDMGFC